MKTITFTISQRTGAYVTQTVQGHRASSTGGMEQAAQSLARKVFQRDDVRVQRVRSVDRHVVELWSATAP